MSRWISKLISRHLEPEHNVRPLLAGIFQAGSEQTESFVEEDAPSRDAGKFISNEERIVREVRKPMDERPDFRDAEKTVKDEKPVLEDREVRPVKEEERVLPAAEKIVREEKKAPVMDTTVVKEIPVIQDRVRTQVETKVRYETRETPVLQDLIEDGQVVEKTPVEKRTVVSGARERKAVTPAPGVVRHHNTLNVLNNNIIPAPERQTVHVSIGRIEIKAVAPLVEVKAAPVKKEVKIMGLDQYLEQRNSTKR